MKLRDMTRAQLEGLAENAIDSDKYAIALELKRRFGVQSALANEVCWCHDCQTEFSCESPSFLHTHGRTRCPRCGENIYPSLRLPSEPTTTRNVPTWQEMLARIRQRFGD